MDLAKKRAEIATEHAAQEKYDPHWLAAAKAGEKLSDRPIAFVCDDEVVVIGTCVPKVLAGVAAFRARAAEYADRTREPVVAQALKRAEALAATPGDAAELRMSQQHWNAVLFCLGEVGVTCVLADGGK
jgi:hypothetical protein